MHSIINSLQNLLWSTKSGAVCTSNQFSESLAGTGTAKTQLPKLHWTAEGLEFCFVCGVGPFLLCTWVLYLAQSGKGHLSGSYAAGNLPCWAKGDKSCTYQLILTLYRYWLPKTSGSPFNLNIWSKDIWSLLLYLILAKLGLLLQEHLLVLLSACPMEAWVLQGGNVMIPNWNVLQVPLLSHIWNGGDKINLPTLCRLSWFTAVKH